MNENNIARNRWRAIGFGALACITLITFVYAFVQQAEAKRQAEIAMENQQIAIACKAEIAEKTKQLEDRNKQLEMMTENLRLAVIDAQQKRDQAQKKLK
jgi:hypothetical protein